MSFEGFMQSLHETKCPDNYNPYLQALWYDAKGDWGKAHLLVQQIDDDKAARIHAYLHRKEGDQKNALYWYRRAGISLSGELSIEDEWLSLLHYLISYE